MKSEVQRSSKSELGVAVLLLALIGSVSYAIYAKHLESALSRNISSLALAGLVAALILDLVFRIADHGQAHRPPGIEQLRQNAEHFQLIVESVKDYAIFTLDVHGFVQTWNAGAQRIKGYKPAEIIGKHFSVFFPSEDLQRGKPEQVLKTALAEGKYEEDGWRVRKNGSRFWANIHVQPLRDGKNRHIGFSKITRDLTERSRNEEQINHFFKLSVDLFCIVGLDGYFSRLNPAWETLLGYTDAELRAKPYIEFVHPDDRAKTLECAKRFTTGLPPGFFDNRYRCKDGTYRYLMWKANLSEDRQFVFAVAHDFTDWKFSKDSIADLNQALQQRNAQLESANKELEAFSYSVSHDLRSPLRSMDGFSQALLEDYADRLDSEGQDHLHRIRAASQQMGYLIDAFLNLSKVARSDMNRQAVDLSAVAEQLAQELRDSTPNRRVEFSIEPKLVMDGDPRLLRIALTNLLDNAWKFTSKRAVGRIALGSIEKKGRKVFFVRDNGAGFQMSHAEKLFGPFQRLHSAADFPGSGIGLATVQRIINRHGGNVWGEGEPNVGATFYFFV